MTITRAIGLEIHQTISQQIPFTKNITEMNHRAECEQMKRKRTKKSIWNTRSEENQRFQLRMQFAWYEWANALPLFSFCCFFRISTSTFMCVIIECSLPKRTNEVRCCFYCSWGFFVFSVRHISQVGNITKKKNSFHFLLPIFLRLNNFRSRAQFQIEGFWFFVRIFHLLGSFHWPPWIVIEVWCVPLSMSICLLFHLNQTHFMKKKKKTNASTSPNVYP